MNEDKKEVFRGHFEECLNHFGVSLASRVPKGSLESAQAKKPMADFCGATLGSVNNWLRGSGLPLGEKHYRLMCFLDMVGYRVIELERMRTILRHVVELIGFGVLSGQETAKLLQYPICSHLYATLRGDYGITKEREQKIWELWKERREELEEKKEHAKRRLLDISPKVRAEAELSSPATVPTSRKAAVVIIMEGLLALLEESSFEKISEDNLAEFHESADMVLNLSARLSALSSRLIIFKERKGGN